MNRPDARTSVHPHDDAHWRALHVQACDALSPDTLQQLRQRRHATGRRQTIRRPWMLGMAGASCALLIALVVGLHVPDTTAPVPAPGMALALQDDPGDLLDENPDLYLWLGSDASLAME